MKRSEESHELLVIPREDLKQTVKERYEIGLTFLSQVITDEEQKEEWWDNFIEWDLCNVELIKHAFDKPNNFHVYSYERSGFAGFGYLGGEYKKPAFKESVESCREEMQYQVKRLKRFLDKINLLKESTNITKLANQQNKLNRLLDLLRRFHKVAQELREGRRNQETIIIKNEYDVQYLLNALLRIYFDDIRKEDSSPSNAGSNSRLDFVLKKERIIIEVKMSSERLKDKELGEELLIDIGRYKGYPDYKDFLSICQNFEKSQAISNMGLPRHIKLIALAHGG